MKNNSFSATRLSSVFSSTRMMLSILYRSFISWLYRSIHSSTTSSSFLLMMYTILFVADSTNGPLSVRNTVSSVGALSSYSHTASLPISAFIRLCSESSSVSITALFASVRGSFVVYRLIIYTSQPTAKRASNNRGTPSFSRNSFVWERFAPRITELISRASSFARER